MMERTMLRKMVLQGVLAAVLIGAAAALYAQMAGQGIDLAGQPPSRVSWLDQHGREHDHD
jgi:hypothetical protein